jgi:hypothetical protein
MISEAGECLVTALRLQKAAGIVYLAKRVTGYRLISPAPTWSMRTIVITFGRSVTRGRRGGIFVLYPGFGRLLLVDSDWIPPEHDLDWNTRVTLRFVPHPDLAEKSRESLRHAWKSREAENLSITTRRALGKYSGPTTGPAPMRNWGYLYGLKWSLNSGSNGLNQEWSVPSSHFRQTHASFTRHSGQ